jgi:hypothetical protein
MSVATIAKKSNRLNSRSRGTDGFVLTPRQKELLTNPHVQASALARLAVMATFDDATPDIDDYLAKFGTSDEVCLNNLGISWNSIYAEEVYEVIEELSYRMETFLVREGLLLKDCGTKWQEARVTE